MPESVSAVIPCFNSQEWIEEAVDSALSQTHPLSEVVCVDDGSTDDTLALLEALKQRDDRVRVLAQSNSGAPAARNAGLSVVTSTWVQFLDADDVLAPEKVEHQLGIAREAGRPLDIIAGSYFSRSQDDQLERIDVAVGDPWLGLLTFRFGITSSMLWRADAVREAGGWAEGWKSSQEMELAGRMLAAGKRAVMDDRPVVTVRDRPRSVKSAEGAWHCAIYRRIDLIETAREDLSAQDRSEVLRVLFGSLRKFYVEHPAEAVELHDRLFGRSYEPQADDLSGPMYCKLYEILGFRRTERLRAIAGRMKPRKK